MRPSNKEETKMSAMQTVDEAKLEQFVGSMVGDLGATLNTALVRIGDQLGLYRAMKGAGPLTAAELAERTGTAERYIREWLAAQAAGGYVAYDGASGRYELPPEQALALADEESPAFMLGGFQLAASVLADEPKLAEAFRTGEGVGWHEHDHRLFEGTERFFRPGYRANIIDSWIPALDGVEAKLRAGARVADVGCGHGASTLIMAREFEASTFVGHDYHEGSIDAAAAAAVAEGLGDRVSFEVAGAKDYVGSGFDLICFFDALHDMGDPVGALVHARESLAPAGTVMIVEPFAGDRVEDNLNPVGRVYYCASTMLCTPGSLDQEVGLALGAQAGEARLAEVAREAGFSHFRRAAETPLNLVLEARA
jgi:SAM-dependent methyltransferase